jgi:hypothetical protein
VRDFCPNAPSANSKALRSVYTNSDFRVAPCRMTKLEPILSICCTALRDTVQQNFIDHVSRPLQMPIARARQQCKCARDKPSPDISSSESLSTTALSDRVARWFVLKPKIQIWVNFRGSCNGRCWYIFWTLGPFHGLLLYFMDIWCR